MRKVHYVLAELEDQDVQWLARAGQRRQVSAGTLLLRQDQRSQAVFIILAGALDVDLAGIGRVALLHPGEMLGEMSFVDNSGHSATIRAAEDSLVLELANTTLLEKVETDAAFGLRFYRAIALFLADRLRTTQQRKAKGASLALPSGQSETTQDEAAATPGAERFDRMIRLLAAAPEA